MQRSRGRYRVPCISTVAATPSPPTETSPDRSRERRQFRPPLLFAQFVDQAQWLADRLGMQAVYGANLDLEPRGPGEPRRQYATAILASHPIVWSRNIHLPRPQGGEQRGLLEAGIDVDGVRLGVANTHLQHTSAVERLAQTERIMELLRPAKSPIVLVGDLNARPGAPELAPLWTRLVDAWPRGGQGDGFTYPSEAPNARIDYVLTSADVKVESARVLTSPASDHAQLVADLALPRNRQPSARGTSTSRHHRGGLGLMTESTLEAFANALELGVTTLELDVQITEDQVAVVTHDRQVQASKCRDTRPAFPGDPEYPYVGDYVRNLTLAQVRTLRCDKPLPQYPAQQIVEGARMSLLEDVFDLVHCYDADDVVLNVETKVDYRPYATPALVAEAHDTGLDVIPWTIDDKPTMASLMDAGVDGIITNYPDRLRELMAERGLKLPKPVHEPRRRDCLR